MNTLNSYKDKIKTSVSRRNKYNQSAKQKYN